jgi:two-component system cell cycle sensor histidine kinase/response regulator CckA
MAFKHKNKIKKNQSHPLKNERKRIKSPTKRTKAIGSLQKNKSIPAKPTEDLNQIIERFLLATKAAQLGIWDWDIRKNLLLWDDMMYKLYGIRKEDFPGAYEAWLNGVHPDDRAQSHLESQSALRGEKKYDTEFRIVWPNGTVRYMKAYGKIIRDINGKPLRMIGVNYDITDRKRTEEALHESEEHYRTLFEKSIEGIGLSKGNKIIDANKALLEIFGYENLEEFKKIPLLDHVAPESRKLIENKLAKGHLDEPSDKRFEYRIVRKDGKKRDLEISIEQMIIGKNALSQSTFRDITERKQAESLLSENQKTINAIVESSKDWIWAINSLGVHTYSNPAVEKILGYNVEEIIGKNSLDHLHQHDKKIVQSMLSECIQRRSGWSNLLLRWRHKNGTYRYLESNAAAILDDQGNLIGFRGVDRDITERKEAEHALKESEEKFRTFAEQSPNMIFINKMGRIVYANAKCEEIIGYTKEEFYSPDFNFLQITAPEYVEILKEFYKRHLKGEEVPPYEYAVISKQNKRIEVIITTKLVPYENEKAILGIITDITERKRAEEALKESEEKYKILFADARQAIFIADVASGILIDCNEAACALVERSREEIIGKHQSFLHPIDELVDGSSPTYRKHISDEVGHLLEDRVITKSGKIKEVEIKGNLVEFKGKKILQGFFIDITERKEAERALRESEIKMRSIFRAAPIGIGLVVNRMIMQANDRLCEMTGYSQEELIGQSARIIYPSDEDFNYVGKEKYRQISESGTGSVETRWRRKDGTIIQILLSSTPLNPDDLSFGVTFTALDMTENKQAERALRESEDRFRRLVESVTDYIYSVKLESGRPVATYHALACVTVTGYTSEEYEANPNLWNQMVYEDDKESVRDHTSKALSGIEVPPLEHRIVHKNGSIRWVRNTPVLLHNDQGVLVAYDGLIADITELKEAEEERNKLQVELIQTHKMQSIGTLAGGIAHDFNNILGIILGYTQLIENYKTDGKKLSDSINAINQAIQRGAALVRQILTFARKTDVAFEMIQITDVVHELFSMLRQTFPKVISLTESFEKNLPYILADRTQIHQALLNLCVNARDAMPNGGVISVEGSLQTLEQVKGRFPAADQSYYICVSVSDTGVGMDEGTRLRAFDPFFTTKPIGKGTGMGLSVVYGIVHTHHGFVDVESELTHGTTFRLYFPVHSMGKDKFDLRKPREPYEIGGTETLLLVEDEELLIEMISIMLESKGYTVYCARDGIKAIDLYREHKDKIDLVLTDMGLPELTGMDEYKKLKEIDQNVKVVFASGFFDPDIKSELLKAGAKGFIQKPYEANDILRIVREVLDKK